MRANRMMMAAHYEGIGIEVFVPQGLIFPLNSVSIPAGYTRFTGADGKHIVGAGSTYAVGAMGGAECAISRNSSTDGAHTGSLVGYVEYNPATHYDHSSTVQANIGAAGGHLHGITAKYNRLYQQLVLIKATSYHESFPADAIVLGKTSVDPVGGLSLCYDDDNLLRSGATLATGGGLTDKTCAYNGTHAHATLQTAGEIGGFYYPLYNFAGNHNHVLTMTVSGEELKRTYLTAWTKTSGFDGATGIIAMWEGPSPPKGWKLCNGSGGTLDLRDYFLILSSAGNAGVQANEANRINVTASLDSKTWSHSHSGANHETSSVVSANHDGASSHGHTSVTAWHTYLPPYYALTFIEKV